MKRETLISITQALLSEADEDLLREVEGLVFWRKRELRALQVQQYSPGERIAYRQKSGAPAEGKIHHLNKYSITIHREHPTKGYEAVVVPVERIIGRVVDAVPSV